MEANRLKAMNRGQNISEEQTLRKSFGGFSSFYLAGKLDGTNRPGIKLITKPN